MDTLKYLRKPNHTVSVNVPVKYKKAVAHSVPRATHIERSDALTHA